MVVISIPANSEAIKSNTAFTYKITFITEAIRYNSTEIGSSISEKDETIVTTRNKVLQRGRIPEVESALYVCTALGTKPGKLVSF